MISVLIDSNILFSKEVNNFNEMYFFENIISILEEIEVRDWYEKVQIIIPNIVVQELFIQFKDKYKSKLDSLKSFEFPHVVIDKKFDDNKHLETLYKNGIINITTKNAKCTILPHPQSGCLDSIISRAINKTDPFEGKTRESDKGFKDVIIWESLLEYKNNNRVDTILLYCNDNKLSSKDLVKEFLDKFEDDIYVVKKEGDNPATQLYEKLSVLIGDNSEPSFIFKLKQRLLSLMNSSNLDCYFEGQNIEIEYYKDCYNDCKCVGINIHHKNIDAVNDIPNENKIQFEIRIEVSCYYEEGDDDFGVTKMETEWTDASKFIIEYRFENDEFYMISTCIFNGDVEYADDSEALI